MLASTQIDDVLHNRLKRIAAQQDRSFAAIQRIALKLYADTYEANVAKSDTLKPSSNTPPNDYGIVLPEGF